MKHSFSIVRKNVATRIKFLMSALVILAVAFNSTTLAQETKTFYSEALGTEKNYRLYLPPDYKDNSEKRYPVVYLLHGYNFARNNPDKNPTHEEEAHWVVQEQIAPVSDCLFTALDYDALLQCLTDGEVEHPEAIVKDMKEEYPECPLPLPSMIIVIPDGDSSFYADRTDGKKQHPPLDGPEFVDGIRKGATGQYETYIHRDLVNHIDSTYRTLADRGKRGIGGFSMGGIGSMNMLLGHPDKFISVSALSAIFTLKDFLKAPLAQGLDQASPEIRSLFTESDEGGKAKLNFEYVEQYDPYYRLRDLKRDDVYIYYDAGSADFFAGMYNFKTFEKFEKGLKRKGLKSYPSKHIIQGSAINGKGMHTGAYWRSRIGVFLAFHATAFGLL